MMQGNDFHFLLASCQRALQPDDLSVSNLPVISLRPCRVNNCENTVAYLDDLFGRKESLEEQVARRTVVVITAADHLVPAFY